MRKIKQSYRLQTRRSILFADFFGRFGICLDLNVTARSTSTKRATSYTGRPCSASMHPSPPRVGRLGGRRRGRYAASSGSRLLFVASTVCRSRWWPPSSISSSSGRIVPDSGEGCETAGAHAALAPSHGELIREEIAHFGITHNGTAPGPPVGCWRSRSGSACGNYPPWGQRYAG